jgi:hypothetical protein
MISQTVEAIAPSMGASSTPWVGGQLPSPWSSPNAQTVSPPSPDSFAQSLEQARTTATSGAVTPVSTSGTHLPAPTSREGGLSKNVGFSGIETMGNRLSKADAEMYRSVENLNNLDPTSPNLQAELLSVSLLTTKASISTTLAMKFSSKINESINTLLKTS